MTPREAVLALRQALQNELTASEIQLASEADDLYMKVERLRKLAGELELADCLLKLNRVLAGKRTATPERFKEETLCELLNYEGKHCRFAWNGTSYYLGDEDLGKDPDRSDVSGKLSERRDFTLRRLTLASDGVEWIAVKIRIEWGWGTFEPIHIETPLREWLKPGTWISDLVEWRERHEIRLRNAALARKYAPTAIADLRAKYGM